MKNRFGLALFQKPAQVHDRHVIRYVTNNVQVVRNDHDAETQVCTWRMSKNTYGHGTVAASIRADMSKKVRLRCHLQLDGSLRKADSCLAEIGN